MRAVFFSVVLHVVLLALLGVLVRRESHFRFSSGLSEEPGYTVSIEHSQKRSVFRPVTSPGSAGPSREMTQALEPGAFSKTDSAGSGSSELRSNPIEAAYLSALARRLDENKIFPRSSRLRREAGEVKIAFSILNDGRFEAIHVIQRASSEALTEAALQTVKNTAKAAPIPPELRRTRWDVVVPILFR